MGGGRRQDRESGHIVGRLLELAVLAERAAGRGFFIRWFVLTLLAHGETIARSYVAAQAGDAWPFLRDGCDLDDDRLCGDGLDGLSLAIRFRLLAAILLALCDADLSAGRFGLDRPGGDSLWRVGVPMSHLLIVILPFGTRPRFDTS